MNPFKIDRRLSKLEARPEFKPQPPKRVIFVEEGEEVPEIPADELKNTWIVQFVAPDSESVAAMQRKLDKVRSDTCRS